MIGAESFLSDVECALIERFGFGVITHVIIQQPQIVEGLGGGWVIRADGFLCDVERALIERFGFGVIAHGTIQLRQIVEGLDGGWVIGAKGYLRKFKGFLGNGNCFVEFSGLI